jgi:hypothetical protein
MQKALGIVFLKHSLKDGFKNEFPEKFPFKKKKKFCILGSLLTLSLSNWILFVLRQIFFLSHFIVEIAQNFLYNLINTSGNCT